MENDVVGTVELEVVGLERVRSMLKELDSSLREVQSIVDGLGTVELELRAVTPSGGTEVRS